MEIHRLVASIDALLGELATNDVVSQLSSVSSAAQAAAQSPADPAANAIFAEKSLELRETLQSAASHMLGPSARRVLRTAGFEQLLAPEILAVVDSILDAKPFLLAQASEQLRKLYKTVKDKSEQASSLLKTLKAIDQDSPSEGVAPYELGVMLPNSVVKTDLRSITKQLKEWTRVIDSIVELTEGQPKGEIPLTSVSAGSFEFFVKLDPSGAMAFLLLVGGVVKIFTSVLSAKKRRDELAQDGYPSKILEDMKKHEDTLIETAKDQVLEELMKDASSKLDAPRRNEMKTLLRRSIDWVLGSMNVGVDVEVNSNVRDAEVDPPTRERVQQMEAKIDKLILEVNRTVLSLPDRTKPLLQLPKPEPEREQEKPADLSATATTSKKPKRRKQGRGSSSHDAGQHSGGRP